MSEESSGTHAVLCAFFAQEAASSTTEELVDLFWPLIIAAEHLGRSTDSSLVKHLKSALEAALLHHTLRHPPLPCRARTRTLRYSPANDDPSGGDDGGGSGGSGGAAGGSESHGCSSTGLNKDACAANDRATSGRGSGGDYSGYSRQRILGPLGDGGDVATTL